jgi:hypothetical protein
MLASPVTQVAFSAQRLGAGTTFANRTPTYPTDDGRMQVVVPKFTAYLLKRDVMRHEA